MVFNVGLESGLANTSLRNRKVPSQDVEPAHRGELLASRHGALWL